MRRVVRLTSDRPTRASISARCLLTAGVVALVWQWRLVVFLPLPGAGVYWLLRDSSQWLLAQPGADPANLVGRMDIWQRALLAVADFPLTGIGLGTFRRLAIAYAPFFDVDPVLADVGHAHNIFLQTALDMGIPGLVAYVAVLLLVAGMGWSLYKRTTSPTGRLLSAGLLTSLLAFLIFSLTDAVAPGGVLRMISLPAGAASASWASRRAPSQPAMAARSCRRMREGKTWPIRASLSL